MWFSIAIRLSAELAADIEKSVIREKKQRNRVFFLTLDIK
jgi:hypothetical protein